MLYTCNQTVDEGWIVWGWTEILGTVISPTALLVLHTSEITCPLQSTWTQSPSQVAVATSLISSWIELIRSQDSIHLSLHSHCLAQPWPLSKLLLFSVWAAAATHEPHKMRVPIFIPIYHRKVQSWFLPRTVWTISITALFRSMKCSCTTVDLVFLFHFYSFLSFISIWHTLSIPDTTLQHKHLPCRKNVGYFLYCFPPQSLFFICYSDSKLKLTISNQILTS